MGKILESLNNGYFGQLDLVYGLSDEEQTYHDSLDDDLDLRQDFRAYLIGAKMQILASDNSQWRNWTTVPFVWHGHNWSNGDDPVLTAAKNTFIRNGASLQDPRLRRENFELGQKAEAFRQGLPEAEKDRFTMYSYGRKVCQPGVHNYANGEWYALEVWRSNAASIRTYVEIGRQYFNLFKNQRPHQGTQNFPHSHHYVQNGIPPPSIDDIKTVNSENNMNPFQWKFERTVFQNQNNGYQRIVHVFVCINEYGCVCDRMAVKIQGSDDMATIRYIVEQEYRTHKLLSTKGCPNILEVLGRSYRERTTNPQLGYLYMKWAPFGSLYDLVEKHALDPHAKQLPEPFLWLVFRGLAEALMVLVAGRCVNANEPQDEKHILPNHRIPKNPVDWISLVHTDIKLDNVVLGPSSSNHYPAYKSPQLIDFGIVAPVHSYSNAASKLFDTPPYTWRPIGTRGWRPPEQFQPPARNYETAPIATHSDTWNIGLIMLNLMEGSFITADSSIRKPKHSDMYDHTYSAKLENLVSNCLELNPTKRPSLHKILYDCAQGLQQWEKVYGAVDTEGVADFARVVFREEMFPIKTHVPEEWGWNKPGKRPQDDPGRDVEEDRGSDSSSKRTKSSNSGDDSGFVDFVPPDSRPRRKKGSLAARERKGKEKAPLKRIAKDLKKAKKVEQSW